MSAKRVTTTQPSKSLSKLASAGFILFLVSLTACSSKGGPDSSGADSVPSAGADGSTLVPAATPLTELEQAALEQKRHMAQYESIIDLENKADDAYNEQVELKAIYAALGLSRRFEWGKRSHDTYRFDVEAETQLILAEINSGSTYWHNGCRELSEELQKSLVHEIAQISGRVRDDGKTTFYPEVTSEQIHELTKAMLQSVSKEPTKKGIAFGCLAYMTGYLADLAKRIPVVTADGHVVPSLEDQEVRILQIARAIHDAKNVFIRWIKIEMDVQQQVNDTEERVSAEIEHRKQIVEINQQILEDKRAGLVALHADYESIRQFAKSNNLLRGEDSLTPILITDLLAENPLVDYQVDPGMVLFEVIAATDRAQSQLNNAYERISAKNLQISRAITDARIQIREALIARLNEQNFAGAYAAALAEVQNFYYAQSSLNRRYEEAGCAIRENEITSMRDDNLQTVEQIADRDSLPSLVAVMLADQFEDAPFGVSGEDVSSWEFSDRELPTELTVLANWHSNLEPKVKGLDQFSKNLRRAADRLVAIRPTADNCEE